MNAPKPPWPRLVRRAPSHTDNVWPRTAPIAATIIHRTSAADSAPTTRQETLCRRPAAACRSRLLPTTRATFVAPMLPLPSRGCRAAARRTIKNPKGTEPEIGDQGSHHRIQRFRHPSGANGKLASFVYFAPPRRACSDRDEIRSARIESKSTGWSKRVVQALQSLGALRIGRASGADEIRAFRARSRAAQAAFDFACNFGEVRAGLNADPEDAGTRSEGKSPRREIALTGAEWANLRERGLESPTVPPALRR